MSKSRVNKIRRTPRILWGLPVLLAACISVRVGAEDATVESDDTIIRLRIQQAGGEEGQTEPWNGVVVLKDIMADDGTFVRLRDEAADQDEMPEVTLRIKDGNLSPRVFAVRPHQSIRIVNEDDEVYCPSLAAIRSGGLSQVLARKGEMVFSFKEIEPVPCRLALDGVDGDVSYAFVSDDSVRFAQTDCRGMVQISVPSTTCRLQFRTLSKFNRRIATARIDGDGAVWKDNLLVIDGQRTRDGEVVVTVD